LQIFNLRIYQKNFAISGSAFTTKKFADCSCRIGQKFADYRFTDLKLDFACFACPPMPKESESNVKEFDVIDGKRLKICYAAIGKRRCCCRWNRYPKFLTLHPIISRPDYVSWFIVYLFKRKILLT
jgi:hypothetical protein